ncbi:MAG: DUF2496 domain-containing protein [Kistimonas sp.]|nr:DUF2496 domain-containing protein [Kistimonas sp.]
MTDESTPEHVQLALDLIYQIESLDVEDEVVLEAGLLVIQNTLHKMRREDRAAWRYRLSGALVMPRAGRKAASC